MLAKYFSIIRNYVLSVSSQRKYNVYHHNTFLDAFRTNSRSIIGRNPSMAIPLLANQDLTPMLQVYLCNIQGIMRYVDTALRRSRDHCCCCYIHIYLVLYVELYMVEIQT